MKSVTLVNATRTAGKMFFGFALLLLAIGAGFGGTALLVYHQLGGSRPAETRVTERTKNDYRAGVRTATPVSENTKDVSETRRVAASSADKPSYSFADNIAGQPSVPTKKQPLASSVPAALQTPPAPAVEPASSIGLNDPESHYIVDSRTGRVIGIDGSVGARREAEEEERRLANAPRAVAVQTPVPEVRVASAVTEYGQPVYHGAAPMSVNNAGAQYMPVRKALPVTVGDTANQPSQFNVTEYLANGRSRSVPQAQPVNSVGMRTARTTQVFRLPDGTQAVVAD